MLQNYFNLAGLNPEYLEHDSKAMPGMVIVIVWPLAAPYQHLVWEICIGLGYIREITI